MKGLPPRNAPTYSPHKPDLLRQANLSPGEQRVYECLTRRIAPKEIAFDLKLSQKTVYAHCESMVKRLGLHDLHALILFAAENGRQNENGTHRAGKKQ